MQHLYITYLCLAALPTTTQLLLTTFFAVAAILGSMGRRFNAMPTPAVCPPSGGVFLHGKVLHLSGWAVVLSLLIGAFQPLLFNRLLPMALATIMAAWLLVVIWLVLAFVVSLVFDFFTSKI